MADFTAQIPEVTACTLSPNPIGQSATLSIAVTIVDQTVILEPYYYFSGDINAGEV